jgi:phytoene desaturase
MQVTRRNYFPTELALKKGIRRMSKKIVVIGSGFGGLGIAIRLQARGFNVTLMEKNEMIGGHAYQMKKDGYTFDMGPSLITAPDIIRGVFNAAGKKMEDYLDLIKLDPYYRIYFHNGEYIDYTGDSDQMKQQLAKFDSRDADNYDRFMENCRLIYDAVITDGLGSTPFMSWKTMFDFIPRAIKLNALLPAHSFVKKYFRHPNNRFTFSFHPLFIGGNPFRSPSVYLMIPYLEKAGGVWFTKGGMYSLVQAFEKLFTELGGTIKTNSEIKEIVVENGRTTGVIVNDTFVEADAVVSNSDIAHTYKNMIKSEHRKKWTDAKVDRTATSMSAFLLYIGSKKQYPQLLHHTLILSERYKELIADIFDKKILPEDFSMYLHAPTRTDPGMAPKGSESMYVLIPVSNLAGNIDWNTMAQPYTERILNFLENDFGLKDLRKNIEVLEVFTPVDFKVNRNSYLGSPWGFEPKITQTAYFRPHNRSQDVSNLYFVGAGTHPGAGLPGVLLTAEATEKVVTEDFGHIQDNVKSVKELVS